MTGKYNVIVTGNSVAYKFDVKRKITVLTGDSATGKTTLADLVANHNDQTIVRRYMAGCISDLQSTCFSCRSVKLL